MRGKIPLADRLQRLKEVELGEERKPEQNKALHLLTHHIQEIHNISK